MFQFRLFGIPIAVQHFFWVTAIFISGGISMISARELPLLAAHVGIVFLSILVHELGHALAGRLFGASPQIILHTMGGLAIFAGSRFNRIQGIIVSAAGPAAGFVLCLAFFLVLVFAPLPPDSVSSAKDALEFGVFINLVWTIFNLLPIQPLDGGQILRDVLGPRLIRVTAIISGVCAVLAGALLFKLGMWITALFLGYLAFLNFTQSALPPGGVVRDDDR